MARSALLVVWMLSTALLALACGTVPVLTPTVDEVPAGEPLPIDGRWRLDANDAVYRIEGGRMYTETTSVVGAFRAEPGRVAVRDIQATGPTRFSGHDLALNAPWTAELLEDGSLETRTAALLPAEYTLVPIELDDPAWLADHRAGVPRGRPKPALEAALAGTAGAVAVPTHLDFGRYHALVIGNNAYAHFDDLVTAAHDARTVARVLERDYGMEVELLIDATRAEILVALAQARRQLTPEDNLVIYYAGHGWLDEDADEGYWLPVDATPDNPVNWIANSAITASFKAIAAKHILVVADSCYSGSLTRGIRVANPAPEDLRRMAERKARVVMTSGGVEPVTDEGGGAHSAFAAAFLDELEANPGVLDTTTLFTRIRRPVMLAADQAPELADIRKAGHEGGDFLFVRQR